MMSVNPSWNKTKWSSSIWGSSYTDSSSSSRKSNRINSSSIGIMTGSESRIIAQSMPCSNDVKKPVAKPNGNDEKI